MRRRILKNRVLSIVAVVLPLVAYAQNPSDCNGAIVICEDTNVDVPDSAGDVLDFNNPNNELGCHITGESSAVWLYFSFRDDMPPGSELRFDITPFEEYNNGEEPDYDFSLFAADLNCDSLGDPLRCSYAWAISNATYDCGFCPSTGLGNGETDTSEGPFGNGFVAPVIVEPGQGFYLYLNEFPNNSGSNSISDGFRISFSGSAAPYLDCGANPNCEQQVVSLGNDTTLCSGDVPFPLSAEVTFATGYESYTWTGFAGEEAYLDDPNSPTPLLTFPDGFSGTATFELEVASGDCINYDTITFNVQPTPVIMVGREEGFCEGDSIELDAGPGFDAYEWSNGSMEPSITVDEGGIYSVTVTPASGLCIISRDVEVTEYPTPIPDIPTDTFLCSGEVDTLFTSSPYADYQWEGGSTDSFLIVDQAGTYNLTVTTENGCVGSTTINMQDAPNQSLAIQGPAGICPDAVGTLSAGSWSAYQWTGGVTDSVLEVTTAGTYELTVTDEFGCTYSNDITIGNLPAPEPDISGDTTFCFGSASALLTTQAYASYNWSTGDSTLTALVTESGLYTVTVTNTQGCTGVDSLQVNELPPIETDVSIINDEPLCAGDTVFVRVEQSFLSYAWEQGSSGPVAPVTAGGTYSVTVTDDEGCTAVDSITVVENPLPSPAITGPLGLCPGENGQLEVGFFETITWSSGETDILNLPIDSAGVFSVTVTDAIGCAASDTFEVRPFEVPLPVIVGDTSLCEGNSLTFGLTESYSSYDWEGVSDGPTLTVGQAGEYSVTVVNIDGCVGSDTVTVAEFPNPVLNLPSTQAYCASDSLLLAAPQPYETFAWSNGSNTFSTFVSAPGPYSLTVTNAFGCIAVDTVDVIENPLPESGLDGPFRFCAGDSVTVNADPAAGDYMWSTAATTASVTLDQAGLYYLTITDGNSCQRIDTIAVLEDALPTPAIVGGPLLCEDSTLTLFADTDYASYAWQGGISMEDSLLIDASGNYELTVTDAQGCIGTAAISITEVPLPQIGLDSPQQFCEGSSVIVDAGGGFLNYLWSTNETSQSITVADEGAYTVTVTDMNGCVNSETVLTQALPEPPITLSGDTIFCFEASTTMSIAETAYPSITWSNGATGASATFDEGGSFTLAVEDANGCTNDTLFNLQELPPVQANISGEPIVCEGDSAVLQVPANFEAYQWSTGQTDTFAITVNQTGIYRVTVTDSFGCEAESLFGFQVSAFPDLSVPDSLYYCEDNTNTLTAVSPDAVTYVWSTGAGSPDLTVDTEGVYAVTVTNGFGCATSDSTVVLEAEEPFPTIIGDLSLCPGDTALFEVIDTYSEYAWSTGETTEAIIVSQPGTYQVTVTDEFGCSGSTNIVVDDVPPTFVVISDVPIFCTGDSTALVANSNATDFVWSTGATGNELLVTQAGEYIVTATNSFGCTAEDTISVQAYPQPEPNTPDYLADCEGELLIFSADNGFSSYLWNNGAFTPGLAVDQSGTYIVTITDANGCQGIDTTEVFLKPPPNPQMTSAQNICRGNSATIEVFGDWSSIQWTTGETSQSITVDEAGSYGVVVQDSLGCTGVSVTVVQVFDVPPPIIDGVEGICPGDTALLSAPDGYADYEWSNGATDREIVVSEEGVYEVTVTDTVGCFNSAMLSLKMLEVPDVNIVGDPFLCEGESNVLDLITTGESILWSNGATTPSIVADQAGTYSVEVRNTDNCLATDTLLVTEAEDPQPIVGDAPAIDCDSPEVSLGGTVTGGSYLFQWSGPDIENAQASLPNPIVGQAGTYTVVVQDSLTGCLSDILEVEVLDLTYEPVAVVTPLDTLDCNTPSITLSGEGSTDGSDMVYQWLDANDEPIAGANGLQLEIEAGGSYSLQVLDTLTGCTSLANVAVEGDYNIPTAVINPNVDLLTCVETAVSISAVGNAASGAFSISWALGAAGNILPGADQSELEVSQPGLYYFIVTDLQNGCQAMDSVQVNQDITPPIAVLTTQGEIDCLNETASLNPSGSSIGSSFAYQWSGPNGFSAVGSVAQTVTQPGLYELIITNITNGCTAETSTIVEVLEAIPTDIDLSLTPPDCIGDENGSIEIASVVGGTPPYMYSFNGGAFSSQQFFAGLPSGSYTISIQDAFGCELSTPVDLQGGQDVQLELGEDQTIEYGEEVDIIAQTNLDTGQIATIIWQPLDSAACNSCLAWVDQPTETTLYVATITDTLGCTATDQMRVFVSRDRRVYIPNAISTNGDGNNDFFTIFAGPEVMKINNLKIFDRWGNLVFEAQDIPPNDPSLGWDGRFRGQAMGIGVFVFYAEIEFVDGDIELYEGDIHLVK
jgi:gliding motility-associated-like protein